MASRVTEPPPAGWLSLIGYVLSVTVGAAAVAAAWCLFHVDRGAAYLVAAALFAAVGWLAAYVNRHAVAWWVRRQPGSAGGARGHAD